MTPSGCGGKTLGPPTCRGQQPARRQGDASRMISASSRSRICRASRRLPGRARQVGPGLRRLPVGRRGDDQPVHRLQAPARRDELGGQPVEQLGMRRRRPLRAEVVLGLDQAPAEVRLPDPVDRHPRRQRVRADRPASGPGPAGSGRPDGRERRQDGGDARADGVPRAGEVAAEVDVRVARLLALDAGPASSTNFGSSRPQRGHGRVRCAFESSSVSCARKTSISARFWASVRFSKGMSKAERTSAGERRLDSRASSVPSHARSPGQQLGARRSSALRGSAAISARTASRSASSSGVAPGRGRARRRC